MGRHAHIYMVHCKCQLTNYHNAVINRTAIPTWKTVPILDFEYRSTLLYAHCAFVILVASKDVHAIKLDFCI